MSDIIRIQMMGNFTVYINERQADHMINKSRKGLALMQYLIMNREQPVSNQRLLATFWPDERVSNPENALKTLISRMRTLLNQVS
ncbi:MAG: winged helix-turn-helix domain-containing protein, partial [Clostridiales bacterium]|nr:winged helix-turn-helix domain-containing protein [Clostridiales bacterium]